MNLLHHLRSLFPRRDTFPAALAPTPLHQDDPEAGSEAEYWLDVCWEQCGGPLIHDRAVREILEQAAEWHSMTGYCARFFRFRDGSTLTISDVMEMVL